MVSLPQSNETIRQSFLLIPPTHVRFVNPSQPKQIECYNLRLYYLIKQILAVSWRGMRSEVLLFETSDTGEGHATSSSAQSVMYEVQYVS